MTETIISAHNAYIKSIVALQLKKQRERQHLFVVEGWKNIFEAISSDFIIETILVDSSKRLKDEELQLLKTAKADWRIINVPNTIIQKVTNTVSAQPLFAVVKYPESKKTRSATESFVVLLNSIQDPGNFGTIIRTAVAAGAERIYCDSGCADRFSAKVIRASAGTVFKLPIIVVENSLDLIRTYKQAGFSIIGTALCNDSVSLWHRVIKERNMVILGNEGSGIDRELLELCDEKVVVPLQNDVESLNVGAAAAIVLFAVVNK